VFEKSLLRRTFGHKRGEMIEDLKKLLIEELHNLYSQENKIIIIK
jgi:hypothetical protein